MNLKKAALSFQELLEIEYKIVVGRKNKETEFTIGFSKEQFFHLVGLQKLDDIDFPTKNKEKIFDLIIEDQIDDSFISKSSKFEMIFSGRIVPFSNIVEIMDNDNLIFKFNKSHNNWTEIKCEFILENKYKEETIYIFIDSDEKKPEMFCKSFFLKTNKDFTNGNTVMHLIYKEKFNKKTKKLIIQLDKLKK